VINKDKNTATKLREKPMTGITPGVVLGKYANSDRAITIVPNMMFIFFISLP